MKIRTIILGIFMVAILMGCDKEKSVPVYQNGDKLPLKDGLCLQFADSFGITHEQIDYYDYSTHMIFLKSPHAFFSKPINWDAANMSFSVYAYKEKIYTGSLFPSWASSIPTGPIIDWPPMNP